VDSPDSPPDISCAYLRFKPRSLVESIGFGCHFVRDSVMSLWQSDTILAEGSGFFRVWGGLLVDWIQLVGCPDPGVMLWPVLPIELETDCQVILVENG
jgi:hypothetical protein